MRKKSFEDYLRTIYMLYEEKDNKLKGVRSIDIAQSLNVSKASVSEMLKKIREKKYIKYFPYSNIFFTKKGFTKAKRLTKNFRVISVFLQVILKYKDLKKLNKEAHRLEHAFSEESIRKIDILLNNPRKCPHGKIIQ
ncbi:metal-dependent transcriptional regulator [Candidatus Woesearchaeota archaeon]|nr:metal-dependent transcriptional regulator [Candidatus Woesearchaeota archaeon]